MITVLAKVFYISLFFVLSRCKIAHINRAVRFVVAISSMSAILDVVTGYGKAQGIVVRQTLNRRSMMFPYTVCNDTDNRGHSTVVKLIRSILRACCCNIPEVDCYAGKKMIKHVDETVSQAMRAIAAYFYRTCVELA